MYILPLYRFFLQSVLKRHMQQFFQKPWKQIIQIVLKYGARGIHLYVEPSRQKSEFLNKRCFHSSRKLTLASKSKPTRQSWIRDISSCKFWGSRNPQRIWKIQEKGRESATAASVDICVRWIVASEEKPKIPSGYYSCILSEWMSPLSEFLVYLTLLDSIGKCNTYEHLMPVHIYRDVLTCLPTYVSPAKRNADRTCALLYYVRVCTCAVLRLRARTRNKKKRPPIA